MDGVVVGVLTLAAAVDGVADEALGEGDVGAAVDVTVFTAAVHCASDALIGQFLIVRRFDRIVGIERDFNLDCRRVDIGQMGHDVGLACLALAAAVEVAVVDAGLLLFITCQFDWVSLFVILHRFQSAANISIRTHEVLTRDTDTAARHFDVSLAGVGLVHKLVRPAEGKLCRCGVLGLGGIVDNGTYRSQLTAAIHALLDPAAADVDVGVTVDTSCQLHRRDADDRIRIIGSIRMEVIVGSHVGAVAAVAGTVHIAPDFTALNGDSSILSHSAELATTIDIALDDGT